MTGLRNWENDTGSDRCETLLTCLSSSTCGAVVYVSEREKERERERGREGEREEMIKDWPRPRRVPAS